MRAFLSLTSPSSYRRLLSQFDPNILHPDRTIQPPELPHSIPIIGFSATFSRHDGLALGSVFERIVYHRDFLDMIKDQWYVSFSPLSRKSEHSSLGSATFGLLLSKQI